MTCQSALEALLDAEPIELDAASLTPLGQHLRECSRCRRVASQLAQDTRMLASAMYAPAVQQRARRSIPALVPALALGGIVLAVFVRSGAERAPAPASRVVEHATPVGEVVAPSAPSPVAAPMPPNVARPRTVLPREFARAVAVAPVRLEPAVAESPSSPVESNVVTVTPPPGTRATVMQTSNPKLVVVWLH